MITFADPTQSIATHGLTQSVSNFGLLWTDLADGHFFFGGGGDGALIKYCLFINNVD